MNKVIVFNKKIGHAREEKRIPLPQHLKLVAIANNLTLLLIQQALDDVLITKDWKNAKKKIQVAIKRGHIHRIK